MAARSERTRIHADEVLGELALVAFSDLTRYDVNAQGDLVVRNGTDRAVLRAVSSARRKVRTIPGEEGGVETEVELKLWNKVEALKLLGQHLGLFVEKIAPTDPTGTKEYGTLPASQRLARVLELLESARARRGSLSGGESAG